LYFALTRARVRVCVCACVCYGVTYSRKKHLVSPRSALCRSLSANVLVMGIEHVRAMTPHATLRISRKLASIHISVHMHVYICRHLNSELFVLQVFIDCIILDASRCKIMRYERARLLGIYQHRTGASLLNVLLFFSNQYLRLFVREARKITSDQLFFSALLMKRKRWAYWAYWE